MLVQHLADEISRIARVPKLVVAMDFDGTLSKFAPVPDQARMVPAARATLTQLAACRHTTVALVSGRSVGMLGHVAQPDPKWLLIGSHGLELPEALGAHPAVTAQMTSGLDGLESDLVQLAGQYPGALVERKPAGVAFHTRAVVGEAADALGQAIEIAHHSTTTCGVEWLIRKSDKLVEFAATDATKADGINALRSALNPDAIVFAGDDGTDEDAIRALGPHDLSIRIGDGDTAADVLVPTQDYVLSALAALAAERPA